MASDLVLSTTIDLKCTFSNTQSRISNLADPLTTSPLVGRFAKLELNSWNFCTFTACNWKEIYQTLRMEIFYWELEHNNQQR